MIECCVVRLLSGVDVVHVHSDAAGVSPALTNEWRKCKPIAQRFAVARASPFADGEKLGHRTRLTRIRAEMLDSGVECDAQVPGDLWSQKPNW